VLRNLSLAVASLDKRISNIESVFNTLKENKGGSGAQGADLSAIAALASIFKPENPLEKLFIKRFVRGFAFEDIFMRYILSKMGKSFAEAFVAEVDSISKELGEL